jgi:ABC-type antimicrobial peptide transport system permease subunit
LGFSGSPLLLSLGERQRSGIRMAFGATRLRIPRLVAGEVFRLTAIGIGIGTAASFALAKPLQSQLYGVGAIEPGIAGLAIATILGVSLVAMLFPARRAMHIEPVIVLRRD